MCEGTVEEGRACNTQPCVGKPTWDGSYSAGITQLQVAEIQRSKRAIFTFSQAKSVAGTRAPVALLA